MGNSSVKLASNRNSNQPIPGAGSPRARRRSRDIGYLQTYEVMGRGNYNSMQVKFKKRYSRSLQLADVLTLGATGLNSCRSRPSGPLPRIQNNLDLSGERARPANDARQRFVYSFTWDLPFGAERQWAKSGAASRVFGGRQLTGVNILQTGLPFSVGLGLDSSNVGIAPHNARPHRVASGTLDRSQRSIDRWFDMGEFAVPEQFTHGNAGRLILDGPGTVNFDLGITRLFEITEGLRLQFRTEFFNAMFTPQIDQPGGGSTATAGRPMLPRGAGARIWRTISDNRQIEFDAKPIW